VRLLHSLARTHASFDDPHLVSRAGLVPVAALAQRAGLTELVAEQVRPGGPCGVNAPVKIGCLVAGMVAGADSVEDMDLLRHGAMDALFGGIRAPSTLGSHLRSYTWGNVRQLEAVSRRLLAELARRAPLLPGKDVLAFIDIFTRCKNGSTRAQEAGRGVRAHRGSAHSFGFAIYSAAHDRYEDAVLLTGYPTGTPQEALDTACTVHLAGLGHEPSTNLQSHPLSFYCARGPGESGGPAARAAAARSQGGRPGTPGAASSAAIQGLAALP
jgi:hypothetical protein